MSYLCGVVELLQGIAGSFPTAAFHHEGVPPHDWKTDDAPVRTEDIQTYCSCSDTAIILTACSAEHTSSCIKTYRLAWIIFHAAISVRTPAVRGGDTWGWLQASIHPFYTVCDLSCSAAVTVATCGNYTTVMPFIPHTEHESVYIQGGCYPLTDERLNPSFPLFFTPFLEYPTCGSITLNNQLLQVASKWKATGINNESSDYMPRAKPQFSVYLAGSQLFIQLDTEQ